MPLIYLYPLISLGTLFPWYPIFPGIPSPPVPRLSWFHVSWYPVSLGTPSLPVERLSRYTVSPGTPPLPVHRLSRYTASRGTPSLPVHRHFLYLVSWFHILIQLCIYFLGLCLERPGCECAPKKTRHHKVNIVVGANSTQQMCSTIEIEEHRGPCRYVCVFDLYLCFCSLWPLN